MIIQEKVHLGAPFAKAGEDIQNGDKIEILDEGNAIQSVFQGKPQEQTVFKVKTRNGDKITKFNKPTIGGMIRAFGNDTAKWKGKTVTASVESAIVSGKRTKITYFLADGFKMTEDSGGYVVIIPEKQDVKIVGGVDYPTETIDPSEIPF